MQDWTGPSPSPKPHPWALSYTMGPSKGHKQPTYNSIMLHSKMNFTFSRLEDGLQDLECYKVVQLTIECFVVVSKYDAHYIVQRAISCNRGSKA